MTCYTCGDPSTSNPCERCKRKLEKDIAWHHAQRATQMSATQINSLRTVLDYLEYDEERHWEELDRPEGHIYNEICELRQFLANLK